MLNWITSRRVRGTVLYGDMNTHFITQDSHRITLSLCKEANKQRKHAWWDWSSCVPVSHPSVSLLLWSSEFNSLYPIISLFFSHSLSPCLSLLLHFRLFVLPMLPQCWQTTAPATKCDDGSSRHPAWPLSPALPPSSNLLYFPRRSREIHV